MASPRRILAHHLYDFVVCEHRIALDFSLPRASRTPPDPATALLQEHGLRHEEAITKDLGYEEITVPDHDFEEAARATREAMRAGVAGIAQGVLMDGRFLARPDLLERRPGPSRWGAWHYVPGDIKSALTPRSDAALQIGFAGKILERVQETPSRTGFVILGDGSREELDLASIDRTVEDAAEEVAAVAEGTRPTRPFFSRDCARCRWRDHCLPQLEDSNDLSFVHGVTRARARAYSRAGIGTLAELAVADERTLRASGAPTEGLQRLRDQARALLESREIGRRPVDLPRGRRREHVLWIDTNPVERSEPYLFAWGSGATGMAMDRMEAASAGTDEERFAALFRACDALRAADDPEEPIFVYGAATGRALTSLGTRAGLHAGVLGDLQGRVVDLRPWVRRAAALPVHHYRFGEVADFLRRGALPDPRSSEDPRFLAFVADPRGSRAGVLGEARDHLESLRAIRDWLRSTPESRE